MRAVWVVVALWLGAGGALAQTAANMVALRGLAPVARLPGSAEGRAALAANFDVTGGIQAGRVRLPTSLPFAAQQRQALKDAFITSGNAAQLADGLGTALGAAYQARARYLDEKRFTAVSERVSALFAYTNETTRRDSNAGKYFFANGTLDGTAPVAAEAAAVLAGGAMDVFGRAYGRPAGSAGSDRYGNARPFQTLPGLLAFAGPDYLGAESVSSDFLMGPESDLRDSPSFPSGHTTYGTMESLVLGLLVPERLPQMMARAAEYGDSRVLLGAHYTMDVIAGRTLALHDVAMLLANDPRYVGERKKGVVIEDYRAALAAARSDVTAALEAGCGAAVAVCAGRDESRFADPARVGAFVQAVQTYGLPAVYPARAGVRVDFAVIAPEAGLLLSAAYPWVSLAAANALLTETQGPGGGFLDDGSAFGAYSRIDLHAAALKALAQRPRG